LKNLYKLIYSNCPLSLKNVILLIFSKDKLIIPKILSSGTAFSVLGLFLMV